ncbi:MAG: hypothetical protein KDJ54_11575 [Candidatus Competibacteraceae bacterium]|nr:hypothetical protein [Candidatus Competibacteraceae bacterium]
MENTIHMNKSAEAFDFKCPTISERPDLLEQVIALRELGWPEYIRKGALTIKHAEAYIRYFGDFLFVLLDREERAMAYGATIPLVWDGSVKGLPEGWDAAYEQAFDDREKGRAPTALCALGAVISPSCKGTNLSYRPPTSGWNTR